MIVTTASTIGNKQIIDHLGIVSGEAILGANIFRDFFAGIRDIVADDRRLTKNRCEKPKTLP